MLLLSYFEVFGKKTPFLGLPVKVAEGESFRKDPFKFMFVGGRSRFFDLNSLPSAAGV